MFGPIRIPSLGSGVIAHGFRRRPGCAPRIYSSFGITRRRRIADFAIFPHGPAPFQVQRKPVVLSRGQPAFLLFLPRQPLTELARVFPTDAHNWMSGTLNEPGMFPGISMAFPSILPERK